MNLSLRRVPLGGRFQEANHLFQKTVNQFIDSKLETPKHD